MSEVENTSSIWTSVSEIENKISVVLAYTGETRILKYDEETTIWDLKKKVAKDRVYLLRLDPLEL